MKNEKIIHIDISDIQQNLKEIIEKLDEEDIAYITKNGKNQYAIINLDCNPILDLSDDEKIDVVAKRILKKHKKAFIELSKN